MTELTILKFINILKKENIDRKVLSSLVVEKCIDKKFILSTVESCTGGLISKKITDINGSSAMFECGVCTYANRIKEKLVNVKHATLDKIGAVSEETAIEMANGIKILSGSDISVSTTGIAGPSGGSVEKPVGLVYLAVCSNAGCKSYKLSPDENQNLSREEIRDFTSDLALYLVLKNID